MQKTIQSAVQTGVAGVFSWHPGMAMDGVGPADAMHTEAEASIAKAATRARQRAITERAGNIAPQCGGMGAIASGGRAACHDVCVRRRWGGADFQTALFSRFGPLT